MNSITAREFNKSLQYIEEARTQAMILRAEIQNFKKTLRNVDIWKICKEMHKQWCIPAATETDDDDALNETIEQLGDDNEDAPAAKRFKLSESVSDLSESESESDEFDFDESEFELGSEESESDS